ncbi:hypothetical protein CK203_038411 [Vitis vinifera]|uniref:Uncharacterized protein n=1 Tax=Vitis vinifera TaxID=29760 RepID=A0A438IRV3_VITVI|nr:hypothetical protein CK203_038411 [Vitis vinifera]
MGSSNHHGTSCQVLKLVDQDKKPTLSIIYEAMDRAKLAIKASVKQWEKYWEVIDRRWEGHAQNLHVTTYFFNPMFQYSKHFSNHPEIKVGLKEVIKRLEPDLDKPAKAINEVKLFVDGQRELGSALTKKAVNQSLPGLPTNEEGRERDVDSRRKGVGGTSEGTGADGNIGGGYVSQVDPGMSWAQGGSLMIWGHDIKCGPKNDSYRSQEDRWSSQAILDPTGRECFMVRMRVAEGFWKREGEAPSALK